MPPPKQSVRSRNRTRKDGGAVKEPLMQYEGTAAPQKSSDCCACTPSMVKTFFIFFTAILLLVALGLISLGAYLFAVRIMMFPVLMGEIAYLPHFLLFVVGILLLIACIIGFLGTSKEDPCLLLTNWLADRIKYTMQTKYSAGSTDVDNAVDLVQQRFKCCGSYNFRDWHESIFQNQSERNNHKSDGFDYGMVVPDSCCLRVQESCGSLPHPSNVYHQGCIVTIFNHLRDRYYIICVVVLSLIAVELIGVTLAFCFARLLQQNVGKYKY